MTEKQVKMAILALIGDLGRIKNTIIPPKVLELCEDIKNEYPDMVQKIEHARMLLPKGNIDNLHPLQSIFDILGDNTAKKYYLTTELKSSINYPEDKIQAEDYSFLEGFTSGLENLLAKEPLQYDEKLLNKLLELMEDYLIYVTAFDDTCEDYISIYDYQKTLAAISLCIEIYEDEGSVFSNDSETFNIFEFDVSGIQDFIYTIHSSDALKMLRSRSFFLEILMENVIDDLLEKFGLNRINLLYSGGGHCYLLLPNIKGSDDIFTETEEQINEWLLDKFDISLYLACAYEKVSAHMLLDIPQGSYNKIFSNLGNQLAEKKKHRYSAGTITKLINASKPTGQKACKVCNMMFKPVNNAELCKTCNSLKNLSVNIMNDDDQFVIVKDDDVQAGIEMPGNLNLISVDINDADKQGNKEFVRLYSKNRLHEDADSVRLWIGNYSPKDKYSLDELAKSSEGIKRLGVLRADIDNLGSLFTERLKGNSIIKTAVVSRNLSLFFKYYINDILAGRNVAVVYSGGDDLFIAGAWNEIIDAALDIKNSFSKYTCDQLTISAGIGIFTTKYPIHRIASETGEYEERSKSYPGKAAVTIMPDGYSHKVGEKTIYDGTFFWGEFEDKVINEKVNELDRFFSHSNERGMSFMYRLLELIREQSDNNAASINLARYAYLLARLEPDSKQDEEEHKNYKVFKEKMHSWIQNDEDRRQLKTAMNIYSYRVRERKDG